METIDDVRAREGNPRATSAAGIPYGAPVPLNRAFSEHSLPRVAAIISFLLGIFCAAAGAATFIVYFFIAALFFLLLALGIFLKIRKHHRMAL